MRSMKILVAYCSKTGTAEGIARIVAEELGTAGSPADLRPLREVGDLSGYDTVVLGGPINGMRPVPELAAFAAARCGDLQGKKTALFVVSYMYGRGRRMWSRAIGKSVQSLDAQLQPVPAEPAGGKERPEPAVFGGRIAAPMPGPARFIFGLPRDLPADLTDPDAVRAWSARVAEYFNAR